MDAAVYFSKAVIGRGAALPWAERVLYFTDVSRNLGYDHPTEMRCKNLASLCMPFESVDNPAFGSHEKHASYQNVKDVFARRRQSAPRPDLGPSA